MIINKNNKWKILGGLVVVILMLGIFAGGFYFGQAKSKSFNFLNQPLAYSPEAANTALGTSTSPTINFNLYWQVWNTLKTNYVDKNKVTNQNLFYGSLQGMAQATGDPYTIFMDPKQAKQFSNDLAGTFQGIGAEVGVRNNMITVISPLDGTPAKRAGLQAGDKIYAVNGKSTLGMSIDAVVNEIRGPKGTKVTLTIIRGKNKPQDLVITRSVIQIKSVTTKMLPDGIFVIRVSSFNNDTEGLFEQAVNTIVLKQPKGIILDLRNNPGGYLQTAVDMASEWIKAGPVVAEQFGGNRRNEYSANGRDRLANFPTVVLVNGGSASASEILAGALRDYKKAILVGETTYGKGSVQVLDKLPGGSELKVTIAHWLTPAGDFINKKGLKPNIEVKMTQADLNKNLDPQFAKAVELLTAKKK